MIRELYKNLPQITQSKLSDDIIIKANEDVFAF